MNAPFSISADMSATRLSLEATLIDIERWSDKLDLINRKVIEDQDGNEGARLESLILRAQSLIGSQASRLLGVDITRFDRARGVGL